MGDLWVEFMTRSVLEFTSMMSKVASSHPHHTRSWGSFIYVNVGIYMFYRNKCIYEFICVIFGLIRIGERKWKEGKREERRKRERERDKEEKKTWIFNFFQFTLFFDNF